MTPWGFVGDPWGPLTGGPGAFSLGERRRPAFFNGKSWPGATPFRCRAAGFPLLYIIYYILFIMIYYIIYNNYDVWYIVIYCHLPGVGVGAAHATPTPRPRLPTPRPRLGVDARSGSPRARALAQNAILTLGSRWGRAQNLKKTRCAAKKGRFRAGWARKRARAAKTKKSSGPEEEKARAAAAPYYMRHGMTQ